MFGHDFWGIDYYDNNYWGDGSAGIGGSGGAAGKLNVNTKITEITLVD